MKDIFRTAMKMSVPNLDESVGVVRGRRVFGVCGEKQFRKLETELISSQYTAS